MALTPENIAKLTSEELHLMVSYDAATGIFVWTRGAYRHAGKRAGTLKQNGYRYISIGRIGYFEHRLAWLYVYGEFPQGDLDHKNLDKSDNRIENLRIATDSQNIANTRRPRTNTSGYKGVGWCASRQKWEARIGVRKRTIYLGTFPSAILAHHAYVAASNKYFGQFSRPG